MTGDLEVDVTCDVCGVSAAVSGVDSPRLEHLLTVFTGLHAHDVDQLATWRASIEAIHAARYDDGDEVDEP